MYYTEFKGKKLSALGFGMMRLPKDENGVIDQEMTNKLVDYAISKGLNYYDTAYVYDNGYCEIATGKALSRYPRDKYFLATKYPGHHNIALHNPKDTFEEELEKCGVDYFDFYLLHNVNESSIHDYMDPKYGIVDYFDEERRQGRIKHLGFSCHANPDNLELFLQHYADRMEFCQIQLNYLDWSLQKGDEKMRILEEYNMPVWIMEPVRGGKLAVLNEENENILRKLRPDISTSAFSFKWLQRFPQIKVILSGMSTFEMLEDNIKTFQSPDPLSDTETETLYRIAEDLKDSVPCTACRYCVDACPMGLNIPYLIACYNNLKYSVSLSELMKISVVEETKLPGSCIKCGACAKNCPQNISIPDVMEVFSTMLVTLPSWETIKAERDSALKRNAFSNSATKEL